MIAGDARPAPSALAVNGMVASPHPLATSAGLAALRDGGTAIDAVIAANAVLTVVYPDQTAIGGDCFILAYESASGRLQGINGSGRSPLAADRRALRETGDGSMPVRGIHAVTVPGTIDAWERALALGGRLGLDRLVQPAIELARDGFPVTEALARRIALAKPVVDSHPGIAALIAPGGRLPARGDRLQSPDLARTLEQIGRVGRDAFYGGAFADAFVRTSKRLGGYFSLDDLGQHRAEAVEPVTTGYRGVTVAEVPPNAQGLTALLGLNMVEHEPVAPWGTAEHLHPLIEAKKIAFAVRNERLGDPRFTMIDAGQLLSKSFARRLWTQYDPSRARAAPSTRAGDTVYLCAVDRDGNAASLIQSLYMAFGSGVVVDGTGVVLQNRGAAFSLDDDHPNRLEGGKRPRHTLMPGMLLEGDRLLGPIGSQGGDAQAQIRLQLVTNLVDYGLEPQVAIDAPRWIAGGDVDDPATLITLEDRFPAATFGGLETRGHHVSRTAAWDPTFGHAQMILRDLETGLLRGAADPRADGLALGY